jgi:hypothetical protein
LVGQDGVIGVASATLIVLGRSGVLNPSSTTSRALDGRQT